MKTLTVNATGKRKGMAGGMPAFDFSSILRKFPSLTQARPYDEKWKLEKKVAPASSNRENPKRSSLKNLAEAIILQSIEDLWSKTHQKESIEFFTGEGFRHCADMADMSVVDRLKIIRMLRKVNAEAFTPRHTQKLARMTKSL